MMNFHQDYPDSSQWESPACALCGGAKTIVIQKNCAGTDLRKVECTNCSLRFFSPRPKLSTLEAAGLYSDKAAAKVTENYFLNYGFGPTDDVEKRKEWLMSFYGDLLQRVTNLSDIAHHTLFEVGGCVGFFLIAAQKQGYTVLDGCEVMPAAVHLAWERFALTGMQVGKFCDYDPDGKTYDLIVMLDFIEHSWTPRLDLEKAFKMTNLGGTLLLKTFLEELDLPEGKMLAPPWHTHHFFGHVLYRMITEAGYVIRDWDISGSGGGSQNQVIVIAQRLEV